MRLLHTQLSEIRLSRFIFSVFVPLVIMLQHHNFPSIPTTATQITRVYGFHLLHVSVGMSSFPFLLLACHSYLGSPVLLLMLYLVMPCLLYHPAYQSVIWTAVTLTFPSPNIISPLIRPVLLCASIMNKIIAHYISPLFRHLLYHVCFLQEAAFL